MDSNIIASAAFQQYNKLPKKGKPNVTSEWTTMSAIIQEQIIKSKSTFKVISIGTGTKCLGKKELSGLGDMVFDSHAEIIARRSFLLYLYEQLELCKTGHADKSILEFICNADDKNIVGNLKVRQGVSFHMFISHAPCGDAAIIEVSGKGNSIGGNEAEESSPPKKKQKTDDINKDTPDTPTNTEHRTGAKLQVGPLQYEEQQVTGKCRVKPGKGDPTLCMSCSDKLAKWQILGLQGSLLSVFIVKPLRLKSVTIGGGVPFNKESLERAVFNRFSGTISNKIPDISVLEEYHCPDIYQSEQNFMQLTENLSPAPASISWYYSLAVADLVEAVQVLVGGRKQGATKKNFGKPSTMVDICRANIFTRFKSMYCSAKNENDKELFKTYFDAKAMSLEYMKNWSILRESVFVGWTDKPKELGLFI